MKRFRALRFRGSWRHSKALNSQASTIDPATYSGAVYFIPDETILGFELARSLGISSEHDLFGGVVPHPFVATKAISHPLIQPDARAPAGWSPEFGSRVRDAVLPDTPSSPPRMPSWPAHACWNRDRPRIKAVRAKGGHGQTVVSDMAELEAALDGIDPAELADHGLVLEENLTGVTTHSVGQIRVGDLIATYYGTQRLTPTTTACRFMAAPIWSRCRAVSTGC